MKYVYNHENEVIAEFDVVIPVFHKDQSLAFSFIGGTTGDGDLLERLQFIITITNIIAVAIENKRLFKRQVEQEILRQEMIFAMNMQNRLMPSEFLKDEFVDIHGFYKPKLDVGGDYYDIVSTSEKEILLAIADISGKGVAAALLMSNIQAILRTLIKRTGHLNEILSEINATIHEMLGGDRFASMFLARYDVHSQKLYYVNAGHNPPLLLSGKKNEDSQFLEATSPVLGSVVALEEQKEQVLNVRRGMQLLMYTDGLTEIMNKEKSFFNIEIIEQLLRDNCHLDSRDIIHFLLAEARDFAANQDFVDDLTLLTCKFL
jgi:sigma-B regulation protein RsbU (phosphoserine phosphatase)